MPHQFTCPQCHHAHRFLSALAGQTMHCHGCGFVFRIPLIPLGRAEGHDFSGVGRWLLRLAGGRQFGPVRREMILEWIGEGRADRDCLVSPENSTVWYRITEVFAAADGQASGSGERPSVRKKGKLPASDAGAEDRTSPAANIPAMGLLDLLEEGDTGLPKGRLKAVQRAHAEITVELSAEAARAGGFIRERGTRLIWLPQEYPPSGIRGGHDVLQPEAATVAAFQGPQGGEFYCVIPWSGLGRMPHEFLSILPGRLPSPVALRRADEESFSGGNWIGITGDDRDVMAVAASKSHEELALDIGWEWRSADRRYQMVLVWGVQGVPLGGEKFAHLVQTAVRGEEGAGLGLRWYLERQSAFWRFARRLNLPGAAGTQVLFASCGVRLLVLASDRLRS